MSVLPVHPIWMFSVWNDSIPAGMNNVKNLEHMLFNLVRLVVLLVRLLRSVVGK